MVTDNEELEWMLWHFQIVYEHEDSRSRYLLPCVSSAKKRRTMCEAAVGSRERQCDIDKTHSPIDEV